MRVGLEREGWDVGLDESASPFSEPRLELVSEPRVGWPLVAALLIAGAMFALIAAAPWIEWGIG